MWRGRKIKRVTSRSMKNSPSDTCNLGCFFIRQKNETDLQIEAILKFRIFLLLFLRGLKKLPDSDTSIFTFFDFIL